jgi:hypothetical protein
MMEDERIEAFRHAASFGNSVYQIVKCIAEKRDLERFLVI